MGVRQTKFRLTVFLHTLASLLTKQGRVFEKSYFSPGGTNSIIQFDNIQACVSGVGKTSFWDGFFFEFSINPSSSDESTSPLVVPGEPTIQDCWSSTSRPMPLSTFAPDFWCDSSKSSMSNEATESPEPTYESLS